MEYFRGKGGEVEKEENAICLNINAGDRIQEKVGR